MKRIFISLWCGFAIPIFYILILVVLDAAYGQALKPYADILFLPITLVGKIYFYLHGKSEIVDMGQVFEEIAQFTVVMFVGNFILYAVISYIFQTLFNLPRYHRQIITD